MTASAESQLRGRVKSRATHHQPSPMVGCSRSQSHSFIEGGVLTACRPVPNEAAYGAIWGRPTHGRGVVPALPRGADGNGTSHMLRAPRVPQTPRKLCELRKECMPPTSAPQPEPSDGESPLHARRRDACSRAEADGVRDGRYDRRGARGGGAGATNCVVLPHAPAARKRGRADLCCARSSTRSYACRRRTIARARARQRDAVTWTARRYRLQRGRMSDRRFC